MILQFNVKLKKIRGGLLGELLNIKTSKSLRKTRLLRSDLVIWI